MERICIFCGSSPDDRPQFADMLLVASEPDELLAAFEAYRPVEVKKWLDAAGT